MRVVVALGGNALLERGEQPLAAVQAHHIRDVAPALAALAESHQLVITHGNGPQVGLLANESASDPALAQPYPLDVLGAESQGMVGYLLVQALSNALPGREVVAVLTRTVVDRDDPAFHAPTKFIGPIYDDSTAREVREAHDWTLGRDGTSWRRVVSSPEPRSLVEIATIRRLVDASVVVVCAGGGGVPVVFDQSGALRGVEAVVDKDLSAALLADALDADVLLILTDVPGVEESFGTPRAHVLATLEINEEVVASLPAGSMAPKVLAAQRFLSRAGRRSVIGELADVQSMLDGTAGTEVINPHH